MEDLNVAKHFVRVSVVHLAKSTKKRLTAETRNPSSGNIIPWSEGCFDESNLWVGVRNGRKTAQVGLVERWQGAVRDLGGLRKNESSNSVVNILSSYALTSDDESDDGEEGKQLESLLPSTRSSSPHIEVDWRAPPPEETLQIPGEPVFAESQRRGRGLKGYYWPAKIIRYVPPSSSREPQRYTVLFMDSFEEDLPRNKFYTYTDDEFGTCKVV